MRTVVLLASLLVMSNVIQVKNPDITQITISPEQRKEILLENRQREIMGESDNELSLNELVGLSEEDFELFAAIVNAEDGADSFDNKVAEACVIYNRVESDLFNDTVKSVIEEHNQFSTADHNGGAYNPISGNPVYATDECKLAIVVAYFERPLPTGVLYFSAGSYFSGHEPYAKIGDNYYCY